MDGMEKNELTNHTQPEEIEDRPQPEVEASAPAFPAEAPVETPQEEAPQAEAPQAEALQEEAPQRRLPRRRLPRRRLPRQKPCRRCRIWNP